MKPRFYDDYGVCIKNFWCTFLIRLIFIPLPLLPFILPPLAPQAKGQFKRRSTANNVEIIVPVPADADSPKFKVRMCIHVSICTENNSLYPCNVVS